MMDNLPVFTEAEITEIWRFRQEHKDAEDFHQVRRRHADQEVLRRAGEREALILPTDAGDIIITYPTNYAYDTGKVDRELLALVERDGLTDEWNQNVRHNYKIDRRWLNRLMKRGQEYRDVIERITIATHGSPKIEGPELQSLGDYAPGEQLEEVVLP